jgi:hypothetical protein
MKRGARDEACSRFAESQRIEPKPGTLLNLALCHEDAGEASAAREEFLAVARLSTAPEQRERLAFALEHAEAMEARAAEEARIDEELARARAAAPLRPHFHEARPASPRAVRDHGDAAPRAAPGKPLVPIALVTGAAVVAGVAVGTYFGVSAIERKAEADRDCTGLYCSPRGLQAYDEATSASRLSNAAFGAAALALGVGVVTYLVWPERAAAPAIGLSPRFVGVGGSF